MHHIVFISRWIISQLFAIITSITTNTITTTSTTNLPIYNTARESYYGNNNNNNNNKSNFHCFPMWCERFTPQLQWLPDYLVLCEVRNDAAETIEHGCVLCDARVSLKKLLAIQIKYTLPCLEIIISLCCLNCFLSTRAE